jgi:hypothetical protein
MSALTQGHIKLMQIDPFKIVKIQKQGRTSYDIGLYSELRINMHVCNILIGSSLFSYYLLYKIFSNDLNYIFHIIMILVIVIAMLVSFNVWKLNSALLIISKEPDGLYLFDMKKYSEAVSEAIVKEVFAINSTQSNAP